MKNLNVLNSSNISLIDAASSVWKPPIKNYKTTLRANGILFEITFLRLDGYSNNEHLWNFQKIFDLHYFRAIFSESISV